MPRRRTGDPAMASVYALPEWYADVIARNARRAAFPKAGSRARGHPRTPDRWARALYGGPIHDL